MSTFTRALLGTIVGTVPGLVLHGVTVPVTGEAELTLGVTGIVASLVGAGVGTTVAISSHNRRRR